MNKDRKMKTFFASLLVMIMAPFAVAGDKNFHDFTVTSIEMEDMSLSQFKGKTVLVVNTASECGFTPQYEGLQTLYETYKDKGLVVLGFPANNFGQQEKGTAAEIKKFCEVNFQVTFPMGDKIDVIGKNRHELYSYFAAELGEKSAPKWNFHKYLISAEGKPLQFFTSQTEPMSKEIIQAIEKNLPAT